LRCGQRLVAKVPHGHWKTQTFVAGLRCDGIIAPCVFDQPINAVSFLAWGSKFLAPHLRRGDVVVMDNLSSHKAAAVRRAIRLAGALLIFLPPYSPDLNPIEQAFSKLKTLLRKENARTREHIEKCIGTLLDRITTEACANYFREAGYST
jgi:transposase